MADLLDPATFQRQISQRVAVLEDQLKARLRLDEHLGATLRQSEESRIATAGRLREVEESLDSVRQGLARANEVQEVWRGILGARTNEEATRRLETLVRADRLFEYMANAAEILNMRLNDALRCLENDDKHGAMACLRDAVTDKAEKIAELLPCAHCGAPGVLYKDGDGPCTGWAVKCPQCGARTQVDLKHKTKGVKDWNKRHEDKRK